MPGEAFGAPGYFRLSYALGDDDLVEGLERLAASGRRGLSLRGFDLGLEDQTKGSQVARVLVTEEIADSGLQELRNAGHEVDIQLGLVARGSP